MKTVFRREFPRRPRVSFLLLDWSCRESLHMLDYLAEQSLPRDEYEIVWIEYFDRHLPELEQRRADAARIGAAPPVDAQVIMEMPRSTYYHKHLMYNLGIVLARGEVVCFCDSDAMAGPGFVESIVREFAADPRIVLHHDQVRNFSQEFYPFRYPSFEDVRGPGSTLIIDGQTVGLRDPFDPLHTRNYGACFSARRDDLIAIGGADMHVDYLGHICGPYEMTFRLVNHGRREVWHPAEFLYHTWHPGQAGENNYLGPHDGRHMSLTALEARSSGRVRPLVECPAIARLRSGQGPDDPDALLGSLIDPAWLTEWQPEQLSARAQKTCLGDRSITVYESEQTTVAAPPAPLPYVRNLTRLDKVRIAKVMIPMLARQMRLKSTAKRQVHRNAGEGVPRQARPFAGMIRAPRQKLRAAASFLRRTWSTDEFAVRQCWIHLGYLADTGAREVVLYGDGNVARMFVALAPRFGVAIRAICALEPGLCPKARGIEIWDESRLAAWEGKVVVAALTNLAERVAELAGLGKPRKQIVVMR